MDDNINIIKQALSKVAGEATSRVINNQVKIIIIQLEDYLNRLNFLYERIEQSARQKMNIYSGDAKANDLTTSYALYKELRGYDAEAFQILSEGYVLIDNIRTFFTNEKITYDIGFEYRKNFYEMTLSLEEIMANTKVEYNTRSKINDLYKLRMNVRKGDLVRAYNETHNQVETLDDGSSTIYSSIWRYIKGNPQGKAINKGNVYEAYKVYKAEVGKNSIPPAKFKADRFDDILSQVRKNTASSVQGGDYLTSQIKFISSAPSLMTTSTVRSTLTQVLDIFKGISSGQNNQEIIDQASQLFLKRSDQVASNAEEDARLKAEEYLNNVIKNLTK